MANGLIGKISPQEGILLKTNRFGNRNVIQFTHIDFDNESRDQEKFQKFVRNYRSSLDQFVGQDGGQASSLSWSEHKS
jgi:hypothetical protein